MPEQIFAFNEHNYRECQSGFRGKNNQEYYDGNYAIEGGSIVDVRANKKAVGASSIIRLQSQSRLFFQRSWQHIREDATDVTVLWFIKRGSLHFSHQGGSSIAHAGEFGIVKSMSPLSVECQTDETSRLDILHVLVPSHNFRRFLPDEISTGFCTSVAQREFGIAERLFGDVFEDEGALSSRAEHALMESALTVLTEGLKNCEHSLHQRQSLSEKRFQDVLRYVEIHLADPKLSADMVAQGCGISRRYLSHLLRQQGTSFPDLIWDWRLKTAHEWLSTPAGSKLSIAEVAFRVGFKSAGHFSRFFKRIYQMSPREYRDQRLQNP